VTGDLHELHCDDCGDVRLFVAPPCEDGHGADCPDLCCTVCGLALTRGVLLLVDDVVLVSAA
jgi:hypothetical protein